MVAIVNQNLAALTVTYNDVQFGGADSAYKSTPPTYKFSGQFIYDDANVAVKGTRYTLQVSTTFYETSEIALANNVEELRKKLSQPRKILKIEGLGTGFGTIDHDDEWGPKPRSFEWAPLGQLAWQCSWIVQFDLKHCDNESAVGHEPGVFTAFNFDTTWQNDYEGICERTMSGYVEIVVPGQPGNIPKMIVDEVRDQITVVCPEGFRRVRNVWHENAAKNRLTFIVTDAVLPGTALPIGCSLADGEVSYSSEGPGFAKSTVTLRMTLKVSPSYPPSLAGAIFLTAAQTKQQNMQAAIKDGVVIPKSIYIANGKFDRARETTASISWMLTKCTASMMRAAGIWEPVVSNSHSEWKTSVENLWKNRGAALINGNPIGSLRSEAIVVDLCTNTNEVTIGDSPLTINGDTVNPSFGFTCPNIPPDGGWVFHDLKIRILRQANQTWHRKNVPYLPEPGYDPGLDPTPISGGAGVPLGGFPFEQDSESTKNDIEYNGLPVQWVALQFRALRLQHKPEMPIIKTIAGVPVVEVTSDQEGPKIGFDALNCPVWWIRGYRIYRVNGFLPSIKATGSKTECLPPDEDEGKDY